MSDSNKSSQSIASSHANKKQKQTHDDSYDDNKNVKIRIDVISDTMCPWCWIGKRNMEFAISETPSNIQVERITWLPYFLDKDLKEEGTLTQEYYAKNYGDSQTGERMKLRLVPEGKKAGVDLTNYCKITHFRPTIRSHRLIEYAKQNGKQNEMVEALFSMFCQEKKSLNDVDNLVQVAEKLGLNGPKVKKYLESNSNERQIFELADSVRDFANGVPTFIFSLVDDEDVRYTFSGAQSPEVFQTVFEKLIGEHKQLERKKKKQGLVDSSDDGPD